jgi:hypothetical protein
MSQTPEEQLTQVRPRFKIQTEVSVDDVLTKIGDALKADNPKCIGKVNHNFITLNIPIVEQHYWSPQLALTVDTEDDKTTIRGVYSPRPTVWTMFVFFYSIIGLAIMVLGTLGLSYLMLDKPADVFWWVLVLIVVFLSLYMVSYFGQRMGHSQMETLHHFFEESVEVSSLD